MWANLPIRLLQQASLLALSGLLLAPVSYAQSQTLSLVPNLSLSVNGAPVPQTLQGEALIFTAVLFHPNIFQQGVTPLLINPQSGSWGNTVKLIVTDKTGETVRWPLHIVSSPQGGLTLDGQQTGV